MREDVPGFARYEAGICIMAGSAHDLDVHLRHSTTINQERVGAI